jgi:ribosome maturation factor RimP
MHRQYVKNIGRDVEVTLNDDSKKTGKLISVNDQQLEIEFTEGKNKKAVTTLLPVALADIKQIIVLIKF